MKYLNSALLLSTCSLLLAQAPAFGGAADVTAADGTTMKYEYQGADNLRINMVGQDSYMLMTGDRMYMVTNQNGQMMVLDMKQTMGMLGNMADTATPSSIQGKFGTLKSTGRSETLAGVKGEVYIATIVQDDGSEESHEMVLSSDPRAIEFRDAILTMVDSFANSVGESSKAADELRRRLTSENMGVLRFSNDMQVTAISDRSIDKSRFELPAAPTDLSALGNILSGQQEAAKDSEAGESGGVMGAIMGAFGSKADRQGDRMENKADDAIDSATDDATDSAVDKVFDKLFGK